jgi:RNA polymerase sigma-70 factor, ECF subfamily
MNEAELDTLFACCMPKLARAARHMVRTVQDSEDILQEGLLSAFLKLRQFQGRSQFSTWLYSITRNAAKMHARQISTHPHVSMEGDPSGTDKAFLEKAFLDMRPNPEESCAQKECSGILLSTLRYLPPMYKRAIELGDMQGLDQREAAAILGVSLAALKTCLHRARRLVCKKMRQSCLLEDNSALNRGQTSLIDSEQYLRSARNSKTLRRREWQFVATAPGACCRGQNPSNEN